MTKKLLFLTLLITSLSNSHPFYWKKKNQKIIGRIPATLASKLPADITYLIADLKYKPGNLKIIEFGTGTEAGYKVLDHMYGKKGTIWSYFWNYLHQFNVPIWYVSKQANRSFRPQHFAWKLFRKHGGKYIDSLEKLTQDSLFKKRDWLPSNSNDPTTHTGIAILRGRRGRHRNVIKPFKQNHPGLLFVNEASYEYVNHKNLTDALFQTPELSKFRPNARVYPKDYHPDLHKKITEEIGGNWYVIKPIFSGRGNGILMVHKNRLDKVLQLILVEYKNNKPVNNLFNFRPGKPLTYKYWKYDRNSHFIVEEYAYSKHIIVKGKEYEPTMRAIFTLHHDQGNIVFNFIDCYWKRPIKSIHDRGTFRQKHISKHAPSREESLGLKVNQKDRQGVANLLASFLPEVYTTMLIDYHLENKIRINRQQIRLGLI